MFSQKDIIAKNIKITNEKEVSIINNDDGEDYIFSALTVEGGGSFKKGIAVGMQEKMVPGLIIYDSENFFGFSEKYGLSLISKHPEYIELSIPENIFENKLDRTNVIQPTNKNSENFQDLKDTEKIENISLNIDLELKDTNNFYIIIHEKYENNKSILSFNITFIIDLNTIISNISFVIINKSQKDAFIKITNNNCYYNDNFDNIISKNSINKIFLEIINNDYLIINKKKFNKN
jgi:hypothetical protein